MKRTLASAVALSVAVACSDHPTIPDLSPPNPRAPALQALAPLAFTSEQKLTAADAAMEDAFGSAVSMSGDLALVGAPGDGGATGSAYVFRRSGIEWSQVAKLTASDGESADVFGISVALSGNLAVVGASGDDDNGSSSGAAYVFDGSAGWSQVAKLTPADGAADDLFGWSVAISGDVALVGAYFDDDNGANSGSAYVFDGSSGWSQVAKLTPADAALGQFFGFSVALSGDLALVGAYGANSIAGSAYLFDGSAGWGEVAKLTPSDAAAGQFFGISVALSDQLALVGAMGDDDNGVFSGAAYVFNGSAGWGQVAKLTPSDGAPHAFFGRTVALSGDRALAGAHGDDDNGAFSGSAYVFDGAAGWSQAAKLIASDGTASDQLGLSVALSGDIALVGSIGHDQDGSNSGAAYVFGAPPPEEIVEDLGEQILALVAEGQLNQGQGGALTIKLNQALEKIAAGQHKVAINLLSAFINQVEDFVATAVLSDQEGDALIAQAAFVIEQLVS